MPKITKDVKNKADINEKKKSTKSSTKSVSKTDKKSVSNSNVKTKAKSNSKDVKKATQRGNATTKKTPSKSVAKKAVTKSVKKRSSTKKTIAATFIPEYYDLSYRYNETTVKLLAQTPNKLFVYWDISDADRLFYTQQFGHTFFDKTQPVLLVYNETKGYSFRVIINDFANSWYIPISDDNCKYHIELGRISKDEDFYIVDNYISITSSNKIDAPNGHVLLNERPKQLCFMNLKTQEVTYKDISSLSINSSFQKSYDFYQKLFGDINIEFDVMNNPSSDFKGF